MKKNLLLITVIFCLVTSASATVHMVNVADFSFTPSSLIVHPGDTVMWTWVGGTHTTTSNSIPTGATAWNSNINSAMSFFRYVPTVLGTYHYNCNMHPTLMIASFTVVSAAGITPINEPPVFSIFPNPASGTLNILLNEPGLPGLIAIIDINGKVVMKDEHFGSTGTKIDLQGIPDGTYFISAKQGDKFAKQELVIKH